MMLTEGTRILRRTKEVLRRRLLSDAEDYGTIRDPEFWQIHAMVKNFTMVSVPNQYALYRAVNYVIDNEIPGDLVECGVWRGGCSMMMAAILQRRGDSDRTVYMYDTFDGMSPPTGVDVTYDQRSASTLMNSPRSTQRASVWCIADKSDVMRNMALTGLPPDRVRYIEGRVEDTLQGPQPMSKIAILRLDTDFYESTKTELEALYPKLVERGVFFADDYGHWLGAQKAVDEYFDGTGSKPLIQRVDYTCVQVIK